MSRVAKYRRQVSEDPDIDNLLSTLSPEEMEQLEKELDAGDPDAGVSAGLNKGQTERASSQREESKRLAQKQASIDAAKAQEKLKKQKSEEKSTEPLQQNNRSNKVSKDVKESKSLGSANKKEEEKKKDIQVPQVTKTKEKQGEDRTSKSMVKEKIERTESKKTVGEVSTKQAENKKESTKEVKEKAKAKETPEKKEVKNEKQPENKPIFNKKSETEVKKEIPPSNKNTSVEEGKKILPKTVEPESGAPENGTQNQAEGGKDDESSSMFDELLEKVKNNDSEIIELNLNNSDCITIETLMSFTEALEFNTVVKIFSLANTRADDHIALVIAAMLKSNKTITSINLDSNHVTGKGILAIFRALQHNNTLTELRFHNQRHICGGKTEMEIAKMLKENTTLLKLGYHFELAGPRMTVTNLLSRNMDKQRQRRLAEQKLLQGSDNNKKDTLEVPKIVAPKKVTPKSSPLPSPKISQRNTFKKGDVPAPPPPPPPFAPLAPPLINENIRNSLSPASQRRIVEKTGPSEKNSRDQLLESIRTSNIKKLKKVEVPKWLK
ncbi:leiomodin-1 [Pelobates cultripes]|uniref:Leiomodin-1 n=1 Tax=Pelobates cultripes TaxID=61616 RepID=A0AAD1R086_PELCU|nr:leiomodin-1 [Pelobates cultripes]